MKNVLRFFCALSFLASVSTFSQVKDSVKVDAKAKKDTANVTNQKTKSQKKFNHTKK